MEETPELVARRRIGAWLREMREEKKMSQDELAAKLKVHRATVSKIEAGKWAFSIDVLFKFCIALDAYVFLLPKDSNDELAELMRNRWNKSKTSENRLAEIAEYRQTIEQLKEWMTLSDATKNGTHIRLANKILNQYRSIES